MKIAVSDWWKEFIIKLLLIWSIIKIIAFIYNLYKVFLTVRNPLIPDTLFKHIAFQYFFLIILWVAVFVVCVSLLRNLKMRNNHFFKVIIAIFLIQICEVYLYQILLRINPFG